MAEKTVCDKACEILQKTNDGDDLDPWHLKLLENAVNGFLNEKGMEAFEKLHKSALAGYKKPWLCGIEHLTIDNEWYVYWKGKHVEHFTLSAMTPESLKKEAEETAMRCRILEARREVPSMLNVVWKWEEKEVNGV